jgi:hypothetical protein
MITEYYNTYVGTEFEGGPLPWLYHIYCGHDNNRDYYAMNLVESRIYSQICYKDWLPQIIVDEHQMGMTGPRMFVPPYKDPPNHNVHPLVWRQMATFGSHITQTLEENGKTGVVYGELFTGWWPGTSIMTPWWHNQVGILFELASVQIATPIYIEPNEVDTKMKMNAPNPWKGGWWRLRDIIEYELLGTLSVLETCAKYKDSILLNQYRMAMDAVTKGRTEAPYAYVLPSDQNDPASLARLVEILKLGGVKIIRAGEEFSIDSMTFPDGSYVIPMAQPYRPYVRDLFEEQRYPDKDRPYDVAGWTLPYQMGIKFVEIKTPLPAIKAGKDMPPLGVPPKGGVLEVDPGSTDAYRLINRLHENEIDVWRERETGTILFKATEDAVRCCEHLRLKWNRLQEMPEMQLVKVKRPRIALFKPWNASMDEGWTRLLLERFEFDFKNVTPEEVKKLDGYDVLILPSMGTEPLVDGPDPKPPHRYPPEYRAGLGKEGVDAIEQFVKKGGTLVCLAQSSNLPLDKWNLPVSSALKSLKQEEFYCPGSILRVKVDPSHPIGYGTRGEVAVVFNNGLAFDTRIPFGGLTRKVVASYADRDVLMSGWLTGEDKIEKKPALVEVGWEKGRIVLFGFSPQFRAQPWGTFKLFFNSLYVNE